MFTKTMFINTTIALSVAILGAASEASARVPSKHVRDTTPAWAARAMAPSNQVRRNAVFDVYDSRGRYVGADPDPRIRMELLRDPGMGTE